MALRAFYKSGDEIFIEGAVEDIGNLAGRLCAGISFVLPLATSGDPSPYDEFLDRIDVKVSDGLVSIQRDAEVLRIEGAREYLANLGQETESVLKTARLPSHTHIEHYPGHLYLKEGGEALIVKAVK